MQHKISDLTSKVSVMYNKSMQLHRLKYDTPTHDQDNALINNLVADLQAMAGDIYNDRSPYPRHIDVDFEGAAV